MPELIVFYDIPSHAKGKAWSPNTWKVRFCLNIKRIPYRTVWVEYPDIQALCESIGASHTGVHADGSPYYTLPVIHDPNTNETIAESMAIARYLDKTFPDTPRLIPNGADETFTTFSREFYDLAYGPGYLHMSVIVRPVYEVMREGSRPYFLATREKMFGKFEQLAAVGSAKRASIFEQLRESLYQVATRWYEEDGKEKLFFMGQEVGITYADITVASFVLCCKTIFGGDSEDWKMMSSWEDGRWARLLAALEPYEVVDDGDDMII